MNTDNILLAIITLLAVGSVFLMYKTFTLKKS